MHAALSSKLSTVALRIAPARVDERAPRRAVIECAHKKGTGSTKNGRDSNPQYLGVKKYGEEKVQVGSIIVRQRGNKVRASSAREREREPRARGDARDPRIQGFRERVESGVQRRATPTRGSSNAVNDSKIARFSRFDRALTRARAFRRSQFHAGDGVGTGKDFTLFALRDGEVMFKVGANKKKFVTVVDAVDRSGRADGQPTRKDKRKAMYSPRAVVRAAQEEGISAPGVERVAR